VVAGCTPSCTGKTCGDDGCGGSCGSCAVGQVCSSGKCQASGSGCGDVTFSGKCDGKTLLYCDAGKLYQIDCAKSGKVCAWDAQGNLGQGWYDCMEASQTCTPQCAGKACGDNGCGGTCGTCPSGQTCESGQCKAQGGCGSVTEDGLCEGKVLKYCSAGTLKTVDCGASGKVCDCDLWGYCDCETGTCTPQCAGKTCGDDGCGGSCGACTPVQECKSGKCQDLAGCGDITWEGICKDGNVVYCEGGKLKYIDCKKQGKTCGYDSSNEYYDCL
jgi:hypothetical protein